MSICVTVCGILALSACKEAINSNERVSDRASESSESNRRSSLAEYIIVLKKSSSIADALNSLHKYDVQVIRDLKKGRYLIRLEEDPGIGRLEKDVKGSEYIKHIQPNFVYTIQ